MPRKLLFLSASLLCLSFVPGAVFAAPVKAAVDNLAAMPNNKPVLLAKAENSASSIINTAEKKPKAAKVKTDIQTKAAEKLKTPKEAKIGKEAKPVKESKLSKAAKDIKADKDKKPARTKTEKAAETAKDKRIDKEKAAKNSRKSADSAPSRSYQRRRASAHETTLSRQNRSDGRSFQPVYSGENCVCVDGFYCIGPRGGHYCYTSGGNKRYLPRY